MFDNRKQRVPDLFLEKIEIDKIVDAFKKSKIVPLVETTNALVKQKSLRNRCHIFCTSKIEDKDGGGTPAGGTVGRYVNTTAIAA